MAADPNNREYRQFLEHHLEGSIKAAQGLGRDDEAAEARRLMDELAASDPRFAAINARLSAILKGEAPRSMAERLALAQRAYERAMHATAARLWGEALAADPKLGEDRRTQHRYNAACAAALAGSGRGVDDPSPDDAAKTKLRAQAMDWLKAELAAWKAIALGNQEIVARILAHWKEDTDLAGIRDPSALEKLPEPERKQWQALWADVESLRTQTVTK